MHTEVNKFNEANHEAFTTMHLEIGGLPEKISTMKEGLLQMNRNHNMDLGKIWRFIWKGEPSTDTTVKIPLKWGSNPMVLCISQGSAGALGYAIDVTRNMGGNEVSLMKDNNLSILKDKRDIEKLGKLIEKIAKFTEEAGSRDTIAEVIKKAESPVANMTHVLYSTVEKIGTVLKDAKHGTRRKGLGSSR